MSIKYEYQYAVVKDGKVVDVWASRGGALGEAKKVGGTIKRILVEQINPCDDRTK